MFGGVEDGELGEKWSEEMEKRERRIGKRKFDAQLSHIPKTCIESRYQR